MEDIDVEEIDVESEVAVGEEQREGQMHPHTTGEVSTVGASDRQWAFKADQCIIRFGDKRKEREKLNSITETGMRTIWRACEL